MRCLYFEVGKVCKNKRTLKLNLAIHVRNDRIFGLIASTEEASNKNENNEVPLISSSSSTLNNNVDEVMCELPKLVMKEFDGSVLNRQTF